MLAILIILIVKQSTQTSLFWKQVRGKVRKRWGKNVLMSLLDWDWGRSPMSGLVMGKLFLMRHIPAF